MGETRGTSAPSGVAPARHAGDPRAHIIAAASRCLATVGLERTSLTAIANESGVSRQTIYKYFATRDEIIVEALENEAAEASERIMAIARNNATAAGYVVELLDVGVLRIQAESSDLADHFGPRGSGRACSGADSRRRRHRAPFLGADPFLSTRKGARPRRDDRNVYAISFVAVDL